MELINVNTLKCIAMINDLSEKIQNGIIPFSEYSIENHSENCIFYFQKGEKFKIVLDMLVDEIHHDAISNYDDYCNNLVEVNLVLFDSEDPDFIFENPFIEIFFNHNRGESVVIESDGNWHFT